MSEHRDTLGLVHLYPSLMGTYGDGGNMAILERRARERGISARTVTVNPGDPVPALADLYVLGGGEDAGQVAAARLLRESGALGAAAERGATIFAVCAGLQVLGRNFEVDGGDAEPGLELLDITTRRREPRAVGEVWALPQPELGLPPLTGYENHGGGTELGPGVRPLATVRSGIGNGAGGPAGDGTEGIEAGNIIATYLHGPVLVRNPELADYLLRLASGHELDQLLTPYVGELREEREAYVRSGKLSASAAKAPARRQRAKRQ
jgi:CobQ-like glutamine amidotransferase family enzyme